MHLLTYTPPEQRQPIGTFPHVVPQRVVKLRPNWFTGSLSKFLNLGTCNNCLRDDRLSIKSVRKYFHIVCDCGTSGGGCRDLVDAVNWWNQGLHWNASGESVIDGKILRPGGAS